MDSIPPEMFLRSTFLSGQRFRDPCIMLTPVAAIDCYHTANRSVAPWRARYLLCQLLVGKTAKKRERCGTDRLTKRDDFPQGLAFMLIHPFLVHRVNYSHHLLLRAAGSVRRSCNPNWAGMALDVPRDDRVEGHLDSNQMSQMVLSGPRRFGIMPARCNLAIEVIL